MTGLDATLFAVRLAGAVTGRRRILKFEGCYHGSHDALMVSIKPKREFAGDRRRPNPVPSSKGLLPELVQTAVVAPFNDLVAVEALATEHADDIAGIILEPVPMNMGYVHPKPGFLDGLRRIATEIGALLIFDEVKTCGKWYGGAEEAFGVTSDVKVLGKAIGGGFPLAAVGGSRSIMDQVVPGQIGHAGTFNANPLSISAGLVTMTKILTRAGMRHAQQIGDDLAKGYRDISGDHGLEMVVQAGGISGTVHFSRRAVTDWRSFQDVHRGRGGGYYTARLKRGSIPLAQRPEVFAVERETELMYLEDLEQRSQLGPEFLLPHDRRTVDHRLVGVPCEGQPTRALAGDASKHLEETLEVPGANAVVDATVEHHIVQSTEIHPRRISDAKVNLDSRLLCFLPRSPYGKLDVVDRRHPISAATEYDDVRPRSAPDLEDRFSGQQTGVEDPNEFRARHAGIPWGVAGSV